MTSTGGRRLRANLRFVVVGTAPVFADLPQFLIESPERHDLPLVLAREHAPAPVDGKLIADRDRAMGQGDPGGRPQGAVRIGFGACESRREPSPGMVPTSEAG